MAGKTIAMISIFFLAVIASIRGNILVSAQSGEFLQHGILWQSFA
jgi:hypothetical protein